MNTLIGPKRFVAGCALAFALGVAGNAVAASPANFVDEASAAAIAQIETSRMAISRTSSTGINSFAVEIIKDYTDVNRDLKEIVKKHDLPMSSDDQIASKAKALMLEVPEGDDFDAAYIANQVNAQEVAIELYKREANTHDSPELKAFVEKYLPKLENNLTVAKSLERSYTES